MSKKENYKKVNSYSSDSDEMMRMIKMFGIVVLVLAAFYLIFAIASGEISFSKKKKTVEIQNVEILAGNTFTREESPYYVLMYDFDSKEAETYSTFYGIYKDRYNMNRIYVVDLGKKFNSKYLTDDEKNVDISSIENLKVVNGTLVKVEEGKGVLKAVGEEEIKSELFTVE